jgi:3-oxoacyl-[acyl-carrier protein] reductase
MTEPRLAGRCALVTGVSRRKGIGFATSNLLASLGADVFIHSFEDFDRSQPWGADTEGIAGLCETLRGHEVRIKHQKADLAKPEAPSELIDAAVRCFGHLDILIANHAYSVNQGLEELTAPEIDRHLQVNVRASLLLTREFAAQHDGRKGGRVILFTSGQHRDPMPSELAYCASKGALRELTLSLSHHLAPRGITVNTVNPGPTDTGWASPEIHDAVLQRMPRGRWGEPDDIARLIAFLVSDAGRWITGQAIDSTGGFL